MLHLASHLAADRVGTPPLCFDDILQQILLAHHRSLFLATLSHTHIQTHPGVI